jgi:hypothetical protein
MVDITFRTTDGAKWGAGKGANLNATEVDDNFWNLKQAIEAIASGADGVGIQSIAVVGNKMTFTMTDLTTRGPFTLPVAAFNWTGAFQGGFDYKAYDLFTASEGMYIVRQDHTSDSTFDPSASNVNGPLYALIFPYPTHYEFGFFFPGRPGLGVAAGEPMFAHAFARSVILPAGLTGSIARLKTAADADMSFPIYQDEVQIGSVEFASGNTLGTFTFTTETQLDPTDVFYVMTDATVNGAARALTLTFVGTLGSLS